MKDLDTGPAPISEAESSRFWDKIKRAKLETTGTGFCGSVALIDDKIGRFKIWTKLGLSLPSNSPVSIGRNFLTIQDEQNNSSVRVYPSDIRRLEKIWRGRALNRGYLVPEAGYSREKRWWLRRNQLTSEELGQVLVKDNNNRAFLNSLREPVIQINPDLKLARVLIIVFQNEIPSLKPDFVVAGPKSPDRSSSLMGDLTLIPRQIIYPLAPSGEKS